jgi:hypothetical protein
MRGGARHCRRPGPYSVETAHHGSRAGTRRFACARAQDSDSPGPPLRMRWDGVRGPGWSPSLRSRAGSGGPGKAVWAGTGYAIRITHHRGLGLVPAVAEENGSLDELFVQIVARLAAAGRVTELPQGLALDLADAFAGNAKGLGDLF